VAGTIPGSDSARAGRERNGRKAPGGGRYAWRHPEVSNEARQSYIELPDGSVDRLQSALVP